MSLEIDLSIIIPVHNEGDSLRELVGEISLNLKKLNMAYEIIIVNDGSDDKTKEILSELEHQHSPLTHINLRSRYGKSAALDAGLSQAKGRHLMTMDGDLQNDPENIGSFLAKINQGFDVVIGNRTNRADSISKKVSSKLFNQLLRTVFNASLTDVNCGFKIFKPIVYREIKLYGDLHRFFPIMAHQRGFKVTQVDITDRHRRHGSSHYGIERGIYAVIDTIMLYLCMSNARRPSRLFGLAGLLLLLSGLTILSYLSAIWFLSDQGIGHRPLLFLGILLVLFGFQSLSLGIVADLLLRQISKGQKEYHIEDSD